eukprot:gene15930-7261_t
MAFDFGIEGPSTEVGASHYPEEKDRTEEQTEQTKNQTEEPTEEQTDKQAEDQTEPIEEDSVPLTAEQITLPTCEENDFTSDGETTDEATERNQLENHQRELRKTLPPVSSRKKNSGRRANAMPHFAQELLVHIKLILTHSLLAAAATVLDIYVGRSGEYRENPPNRQHRSVCFHTPNAHIIPSALIKKLAEARIKSSHLQRLSTKT